MYQKEKSYLELKVTFVHILILLISLIFIGGFLFYLGYSAGKNSVGSINLAKNTQTDRYESDEVLDFSSEKKDNSVKKSTSKSDEISSELEQYNEKKKEKANTKIEKVKTINRKSYFSIQVGSFNSHKLAKNYASRFTSLGYQTDISQVFIGNKIWFRVRVGVFHSLSKAKHEKNKLEIKEKAKFSVVKSN